MNKDELRMKGVDSCRSIINLQKLEILLKKSKDLFPNSEIFLSYSENMYQRDCAFIYVFDEYGSCILIAFGGGINKYNGCCIENFDVSLCGNNKFKNFSYGKKYDNIDSLIKHLMLLIKENRQKQNPIVDKEYDMMEELFGNDLDWWRADGLG